MIGERDQRRRVGSTGERTGGLTSGVGKSAAGEEAVERVRARAHAHAYRSEDYDGVKDFARGCMRTYLILKEKGRVWNSHPGIREILDEIDEANSAAAPEYSDSSAADLLGREFDRKALASKGLMYERLDQLTMDILFGVEG